MMRRGPCRDGRRPFVCALPFVLMAGAAGLCSGCSWVRWSGHSSHSGAEARQQHDAARPPTELTLPATAAAPGAMPMTAMLYAEKAAQARREAELHEEGKRMFLDSDPEAAAHCDRLARQLRLLAADYDEAAALDRRKAGAPVEPRR